MGDHYYGNTEKQIVRKFCREENLDVEQALVTLVKAMVERHVDCELRKSGDLPPRPGGNRAEALIPVMDALHERRHGETAEAKRCELLFRMLTACNMIALDRIEEESRPKMRLVE